MKQGPQKAIALAVFAFGAAAHAAETQTYHVSPQGNDRWSGRFAQPAPEGNDGPFATLSRAQEAVRSTRQAAQQGLVEVIVQAGEYTLAEPLVFGPSDSGTHSSPITWRGSGKVIISGGRRITGWRETTLNGKAVWAADLPEVRSGKWYFHQLFVNGQRRSRPRLPKKGFYRFTGSPQFEKGAPYNQGWDRVNFEPGHIRNWRNLSDVEIVALHFWVSPRMHIASVDESAKLAVFTAKTHRRLTNSFDQSKFARYYVDNVREALTEPGEWYLDRQEGTLYYLPMPGETPANSVVVAPQLPELLRIAGQADKGKQVEHLAFRGLAFEHAEWYAESQNVSDGQASIAVPGAVYLAHARNCTIRDCTVSHVSNYGVEVAAGGQNIIIEGNTVTDLGAGGVKIGHDSNRTRLINNDIGDGGHIFHNAVGVWIGHSNDNTLAHNDIHHFFYTGVSVGWVWGYAASKSARNIVEFNRVHHIGQGLLSDMAGVYTLGVSPGTCVRNNLIHDIEADEYGGWGLYTDEGSSGIVMENNVVYRTTHGGFHQHYGKDNVIRNNVLAFAKHAQVARTREENHKSFTFERNIVYFDTGTLLGSNWKNDHYEMDRNLYWRTNGQPFDFAGATLEAWQKRGHDVHSIITDPCFVDPARDNFALKPGSPAEKIGFVAIDIAKTGTR